MEQHDAHQYQPKRQGMPPARGGRPRSDRFGGLHRVVLLRRPRMEQRLQSLVRRWAPRRIRIDPARIPTTRCGTLQQGISRRQVRRQTWGVRRRTRRRARRGALGGALAGTLILAGCHVDGHHYQSGYHGSGYYGVNHSGTYYYAEHRRSDDVAAGLIYLGVFAIVEGLHHLFHVVH